MADPKGPTGSRWAPLLGMAQLAVGNKAGIEQFGGTPQSYLTSLAPLLALPLAGALLLLLSGQGLAGIGPLLLTLVALLGPAVLSQAISVRWGRGDAWLRYATASNWCHWMLPVAMLVLWLPVQATLGDMGPESALQGLVMVVGTYELWLDWTVARHGLALTRWRAAGFVTLVNLGTAVLLLAPNVVQRLLNGPAN